MDPLTAIGAVASIAQLAQGALSLSKTLYSLGAAVASANDDIQVLADDLKTFSQSLTLLSRLLEDSKSWYSDDIYLLTAKIIKDCAELYVKIDKILVKLGGNGKSTWKLRVKYVYKEGQIRKLMKRLRDMKGTLATILMSLQVDLQLSLLNISSSSKIQREPEKPLQPETIQTLVGAQKAAQQTGFLSGYTVANATPPSATRLFQPINMIAHQEFPRNTARTEILTCERTITESRRSPSSLGSFRNTAPGKRSLYEPEARNEVEQQVRPVRSVLHAFRTALEVLAKLMEERRIVEQQQLYPAAMHLERSLVDGEKEFKGTHERHFKLHGPQYTQSFTDSHNIDLQDVSSTLMKDVVTPLHVYSADHVIIKRADFKALRACSEKCQVQAIFVIIDVASSVATAHSEIDIDPHSSLSHPEIATKPPIHYTYKRFASQRGDSNLTEQGTAVQLDQKDMDALREDQPVLTHSPYRARGVTSSRLSDTIDPVVSAAIPHSSREPDRLIHPSHTSSISPVSPLSLPACSFITPILSGGTGGEWYPTMATSIPLQVALGPPINRPQYQKSQGPQPIPQTHLRAASQSQYPGKLLGSPDNTVQTAGTQLQRIEAIRQQQNLNPIPPNVQSQQPIPMGDAVDFGSFMGNVENIIDQQQQGVAVQAACQMAVPFSGTEENAMSQPQFVLPSPITIRRQQQELIQLQRQQQAARQALMAQPSGMPMGVPNGMGQTSHAQFAAMRGGPMARPVNLPQNLQQAEQQAQHNLGQQQQQKAHQQQIITQQMAMPHQAQAQGGNPAQPGQMNPQQMQDLQQAQMTAAQQAQQLTQNPLEQQQQMSIPQQRGQIVKYKGHRRSQVVPQVNVQGYPLQGSPFAVNGRMPFQGSPAMSTLNAPLRTPVSPPGSHPMLSGQQLPQYAQNGGPPPAVGHGTSNLFGSINGGQSVVERVPTPMWTSVLPQTHHSFVDSAGEEAQASPRMTQFLASQSPEELEKRLTDFVYKLNNYQQSWEGAGERQCSSPRDHPGLGDQGSMSQRCPASRPASHSPPGWQNITLPPVQVRADTQEAAAGNSPSHLELARPLPRISQERTAQTSMALFDSGPADKDAFFDFDFDSFQGPWVDLAQRRRIQNQISQTNYRKKLKRSLGGMERLSGSASASPPSTYLSTTSPTQSPIVRNGIEDDSTGEATGSTSKPVDATASNDPDTGERRASILVKKKKLKQLKQEQGQRAATARYQQIQQSPIFPHFSGDFVATSESSYPSIIHASYSGRPSSATQSNNDHAFSYLPPLYPALPALSHMSRSPRPVKAGSQLPYLSSQDNSYPYQPPRQPPVVSRHSYSSQDNFCSPFLDPSLMDSKDVGVPSSDSQKDHGGILTEVSNHEKRKLALLEDSFRKMEQGQPSRKKKRISDGPTMGGPTSLTNPQPASKSRERSVSPRRLPEGEVEITVEIVSPDPLRSDDPFRKLWWQAYCFLNSSQPPVFECLSAEIKKLYGKFLSNVSDYNLSTQVADLVGGIDAERYRCIPYLMPLADYQANIVKVVMTISSQLGLEKPVMGWAFVGVLLSIYEQLFETWDLSLPGTDFEAMAKSFQQLQDLVGLLARYAVMENLYHQNASLTLTPEYRNGLQDLCITILQYFGNALVVARGNGKEESTSVVECQKSCDALIDEIKEKDKACQGFCVMVDADEQSDTESEDTEIQHASDGSWEDLGAEESSASERVA